MLTKMHKPLISIIMPTYNSQDFIEETIASVIQQTYTHWELQLVDDASSDASVNMLEQYAANDQRIKYTVLSENSGAAIARNKAIELATGTYIAFLDADDVWYPQKLEKQLAFMEATKIAASFSSYELMDEQGNSLHKIVEALPKVNYQKMLKSNYIGNLTAMYNAEILGKVYMPNIRKRQDWALWLIVAKKVDAVYSIQEPLAKYRVRKNSISSNKINLLKYNYAVYKKVLNFGVLKSGIYLMRFLIEHFFIKPKQTKPQ